MQELVAFGRGVAPPIVAALLLVGALGWRWLSLAIAIGLAGAYVWLMGSLPLPGASTDGVQWIVWCVCAVALGATATELAVLTPRAGAALTVLVLVAEPWLVTVRVRGDWTTAQALVQMLVPGCAAALLAMILRRDGSKSAGLAPPVLWTCMLSVDALVILQAGSALLAQLAGAVAAGLATATCIAKLRGGFPAVGAHVGTLVGAHAALLLGGYHFTYLASFAALAAAALAPLGLAFGNGASASSRWLTRLGIAWSCSAMAIAVYAAIAAAAE